jgi:hypothetical protein
VVAELFFRLYKGYNNYISEVQMRKLIVVMLLLSLLLTSCNFPLASSTPETNLVSTKVAATLSAVQTQAQLTTPLESNTDTPEPPTATPEPTFTPTNTATSTPPPGDPALLLGEPWFSDTFTNGTAFGLSESYEDDSIRIEVKNGAMVFTSLRAKGGMRWRLTSRNPQNQYLEGTFTTLNCTGSDQYGLVARAPSYSDGIGYYFGVTCDGQYYLLRWDAQGQNSLLNLTSEDKLIAGPNQTNRLGILLDGTTIRLYVNGNLVKELSDDGITDKGYIGAFFSAREDPALPLQLEQIKQWTQP